MNNSKSILNIINRMYIPIIFIGVISCSDDNSNKKFYESGNLKTQYYLEYNDTIKIEHYYDEDGLKIFKEIKGYQNNDSIKVFYKNGNLFKKGIVTKEGVKKGNWLRYTKEGFLSDIREYYVIKDKSIINRQFFLTKKGDTTWYAKKFNTYDQEDFKGDTLSSRNSTMNLFDFYSKDTIMISEPFSASIRCNSPLARKYNSEIIMLIAKEESNFNENFSNVNEVVLDTFLNLKHDTKNQVNFPEGTNHQYVAVFGRWFKTPGEKILRGYMKEYFERDPTINDSIIKGERKVYFEKRIYVKDTLK